ncbi:MAG: o-succinylbenzoate synthase [Dehalococcoidales bacterium]|nr:o-succinylbenzoate synthase [Dehalococcoidales bacterium]
MIISGIGWHGYSLPFRRRFISAGSAASTRFGLLVFVRTSEGIIGIGEASPVGAGSLAEVDGIVSALDKIAPRLLNHIDAAERFIIEGLPPALSFGLETALRDIRGQSARVSLTALYGGKPSPLVVNAIITAAAPEQAAAEAKAAIKAGFACIKLKVGGGTLEKEEAMVAAVRRAVGLDMQIRLDANQAWSVEQAIEAIRCLAKYDLEYVEQPVAANDIDGMAKVRRAVSVPLAADESLGSIVDLHHILDAGAADIFIIKAARLGGFRKSLNIANEAAERGHPVVVTTALESGIGIAASAHLAAAIPSQTKAHGLATGFLLEDDLLSVKWAPADGFLPVPANPGLGVKVNAASLKKYSSGIIGSVGSLSGLEEYL